MPQELNSENEQALPGHVASTAGLGVTGAEAMQRGADISPCGLYRYDLWRRWSQLGGVVMFVGLNPSTADATLDDPTIRRCIGFARYWGFGGLVMTNLFAWRATDPRDMRAAAEPVGPRNDDALRYHSEHSSCVVAAWGAHGTHQGRDAAVRAMLPRLHYLRLTKNGHPGHPLYLPASLRPVEWLTPNPANRADPPGLPGGPLIGNVRRLVNGEEEQR